MKSKGSEPPSLFDNLDLFAHAAENEAEKGEPKEEKPVEAVSGGASSAETSLKGLTGRGPMRDLYDFNFRQYSAYVICSRAIPAIEDGLKPVQRRIMHSLWEKDDGKYTKVANIVGHAMQYHPHGDASIGDAIVVLANKLWGEGRGYLIDGQGNYGSLYTGMPHAATRYIECRLTELAERRYSTRRPLTSFPTTMGARRSLSISPRRFRSF